MVVQNGERIAVISILHPELALEIRLPHVVARILLEPRERLTLPGLLNADAAVPMQDVVDGLHTGQSVHAIVFQLLAERLRAPARIIRAERYDLLLDIFRRARR